MQKEIAIAITSVVERIKIKWNKKYDSLTKEIVAIPNPSFDLGLPNPLDLSDPRCAPYFFNHSKINPPYGYAVGPTSRVLDDLAGLYKNSPYFSYSDYR